MRTTSRFTFVALLMMKLITGCIEPFDPPVSDEETNLLVVDGFLEGSSGLATVSLSRTLPLTSEDNLFPPETGASVHVEREGAAGVQLSEIQPGRYEGIVPGVSPGNAYRIHIRASNGRTYASEYVSVQDTPPIDSVSLSPGPEGIELQVSTHDDSGKAAYFRWNYIETFEYRSVWSSLVMFSGDEIVYRPPELSIHTCWKTNPSTRILVESTERLSAPVVSRFPLVNIPKGSQKLSRKYSLLVSQQALTRESYNYWLNLQKTTEQLGGLFDPLPSEISGNISATSGPAEVVIGYFSASTKQELRIFITPADLPEDYYYRGTNYSCALDTILRAEIDGISRQTLLVADIFDPGSGVSGYTTAPAECIDCRLAGGDVMKPDFWE